MLLSIHHITFPIEDPLLKYLIEIIIILCIPLLLNKIKVPHLLGLIIAGALIGPNGFGVLSRDSSVVVTGTTGLLYIMFLAGLEIDMADFKKNKWKTSFILILAVWTGLEPATPCVTGMYSNQLNYQTLSLLFRRCANIVFISLSANKFFKNLTLQRPLSSFQHSQQTVMHR